MAMGQQKDRQGDLMVGWSEMPRSPGHVFYDRLQSVLVEADFDAFVEAACKLYLRGEDGGAFGAAGALLPYAPGGLLRGHRQLSVGWSGGARIPCRCGSSYGWRAGRTGAGPFLAVEDPERVLPHEVHAGGLRLGSGADCRGRAWSRASGSALMPRPWRPTRRSGLSCGAPLPAVRAARATGRCWNAWPRRAGSRRRRPRTWCAWTASRKGKKLSNEDWVSKSDPEAKIAKMKDGATHLAYKPEHAVDLDTGAVVAAELHPADEGDTTTLAKTLAAAKERLEAVEAWDRPPRHRPNA